MKKIIVLFIPLIALSGCVKITEEDIVCEGGTVETPVITVDNLQKNLGETIAIGIENDDLDNIYIWSRPDGTSDTSASANYSIFLTSTELSGKHTVKSKNTDLLCVSSVEDFTVTVNGYVPSCPLNNNTVTLGTNSYSFFNGQEDIYTNYYRVTWSQSSNTLQLNMGNYYQSESIARAFKVRTTSSNSLKDDECNMNLTISGQGYTAQSGTVYVYYESFDYKVVFCNVIFKRNTNSTTYNSKADLTFY